MKKFKSIFRSSGDKKSRRDSAHLSSGGAPAGAHVDTLSPTVAGVPQAQADPSTTAAPKQSPDDGISFGLRVDKKMWPAFDLGEDTESLLNAAGRLHMDYTDRPAGRWAKGLETGPLNGAPLFGNPDEGAEPSWLPPLLFDLELNKTVRSCESDASHYFIISHVWGETMEVSGDQYGVSWKIPIRNQQKLSQMLEAARVVVGVRYAWVDVLCLDQSTFNGEEIERMEQYLTHASGCFVWLDNTYDDPAWSEVLNAITKVNGFYKHDKHGTPEPGSLDQMLQPGDAGGMNLKLKDAEALLWISELFQIANASWFRRVWTLQEGVIPEEVYFCTPERYMTSGSFIWTLSALCETMVAAFLQSGSMTGTAIYHELQISEVHKMLKLRQAYRHGQISFWHLVQATRTRDCYHELDRVYGVSALIHGRKPFVDYNISFARLYNDLYSGYINAGDLGPCMFLGGKSIYPDRGASMGHIQPMTSNRIETHSLNLTAGNRVQMNGVGADFVDKVHCFFTADNEAMKQWQSQFPSLLDLPAQAQIDVAKAFGLDPTLHQDTGLCPAAFAALLSNGSTERLVAAAKLFAPDFQDMLFDNAAKALLQWIKITYFMQDRADAAFAIVWTTSGDAQMAVVTEPVEGSVIAITPSSYMTDPGPGCILGKLTDDGGSVRKIGLGLGRAVKAARLVNFDLVE